MEGKPMRITTKTFVLALAALALMAGGAQAKATAAQSCEAAKEKDAGKAAQCRLVAAAKFAGSAGGTADIEKRDAAYAKCQSKMSDAYAKADAKYGTACAVPGNATTIDALTAVYADEVVRLNQPTARYVDNGNGTVTDSTTGLVWEQKTNDGGVHDWDNTYSWTLSGDPWPFDGTAATVFLATLNAAPCFGGFCDWRLPTLNDLETIRDLGNVNPAVPAVFNTNCTAGCTVTTCSCTRSSIYWSSSTYQDFPYTAWGVFFDYGNVDYVNKSTGYYVRAVRGGS
jgi:Protein of unknown function (DUF1566)